MFYITHPYYVKAWGKRKRRKTLSCCQLREKTNAYFICLKREGWDILFSLNPIAIGSLCHTIANFLSEILKIFLIHCKFLDNWCSSFKGIKNDKLFPSKRINFSLVRDQNPGCLPSTRNTWKYWLENEMLRTVPFETFQKS